MSKVLVIGALPSSLINFRKELLEALVSHNYQVMAMASGATEKDINDLNGISVKYQDYTVSRNGLNPISDLRTLKELVFNFQKHSPQIVLAYTIKPIIWGGIAARISNVTNFNAMITGLGYAFENGGVKKKVLTFLVKMLYKSALKNAKSVIFQNPDNMNLFIEQGIVSKEKCHLVNGSGVNLERFTPQPLPNEPRFLLIARLLRAKGIYEYVEAAKIVGQKYPNIKFDLLGPVDSSPDGISLAQVESWVEEGIINYLGSTSDVRPYIAKCSTYVLPSYHEGLPRSVIEAMACGRAILTTDVPGCRETVVQGLNGWIIEKGNAKELAEKFEWFIHHPQQNLEMGKASLKLCQDKYDVNAVNKNMIAILNVTDKKTVSSK